MKLRGEALPARSSAVRAPGRLIDGEGRLQTGIHPEPIEDLNCLDFRVPGSKRKVSSLRIKRWEYIGIVSDGFIIGGAIVSLRYLGNAFFYVFDRKHKSLTQFSFIAPLCRGIGFSTNGISGEAVFEKGRNRLRIKNDRTAGLHRLDFFSHGIAFSAEIETAPNPLVYASRIGFGGFNYTLKSAGMPVRGELTLGGGRHSFNSDSFGVIDFTTGCPARETFWNWASAGGRDSEGNLVGINFVQGINETGLTENAFWINNHLFKTDTLTFTYDDLNVLAPWRIRSSDGKVDLTFTPEGERKENVDLKVLVSRFHQPFGRFSGILVDADGVRHAIENMAGYTEEHFARW